MNAFVVFSQKSLILILVALIHNNTSMLFIYLSLLSFMHICLLFTLLFFQCPSCIFILTYIRKIKYTYSPLKKFILHRYKKRNNTLRSGKRRKVANSREPLLLSHKEKRKGQTKRIACYRQVENETNIY